MKSVPSLNTLCFSSVPASGVSESLLRQTLELVLLISGMVQSTVLCKGQGKAFGGLLQQRSWFSNLCNSSSFAENFSCSSPCLRYLRDLKLSNSYNIQMLWESCELGAFQACHYALLPWVATPDHWIANCYTVCLFFQLSPGLFGLSSEQKDTRSPSDKENLLVESHLPITRLNVFLHKSRIPQVQSSPSELWQIGLCQPNSHLLPRNASPGP